VSHSSAEAIFALELQAVNKQFSSGSRSVNALRSVSLTIDKGAVVGLVGPDGAGKTTLLRFTYGANWISPSTPCVRFNFAQKPLR
jgi:ABC-type Na+ transport system ATPase subunit NatA